MPHRKGPLSCPLPADCRPLAPQPPFQRAIKVPFAKATANEKQNAVPNKEKGPIGTSSRQRPLTCTVGIVPEAEWMGWDRMVAGSNPGNHRNGTCHAPCYAIAWDALVRNAKAKANDGHSPRPMGQTEGGRVGKGAISQGERGHENRGQGQGTQCKRTAHRKGHCRQHLLRVRLRQETAVGDTQRHAHDMEARHAAAGVRHRRVEAKRC